MSIRRGTATATAIAAALLALGATTAAAEEGSVLVGHPATFVAGGVSENLGCPAGGDARFDGIDGAWFAIPETTASIIIDPSATLDADGFFYTADCSFIEEVTLAQAGLGSQERGNVPEGAAFVVVDGFVGTGSFTIDFRDVPCEACDPP